VRFFLGGGGRGGGGGEVFFGGGGEVVGGGVGWAALRLTPTVQPRPVQPQPTRHATRRTLPRVIESELDPSDADRFYFFNSFFFKKLTEEEKRPGGGRGGGRGAAAAPVGADGSRLSGAELKAWRDHERVKKWTKVGCVGRGGCVALIECSLRC